MRVRRGKTVVTIDLIGDLTRRYGPLDLDASSSKMGEVGKVTFDQEVLMMKEKLPTMMGVGANDNC
jgi:hypothetical protein